MPLMRKRLSSAKRARMRISLLDNLFNRPVPKAYGFSVVSISDGHTRCGGYDGGVGIFTWFCFEV